MEEFFDWLKKEKGISKISLEKALEDYYDEWKESRKDTWKKECQNCKEKLKIVR